MTTHFFHQHLTEGESQSGALNEVVYFAETLKNGSGSFGRNTDAGISHIELYKILFIEETEMNLSSRGKLYSIAEQVTYDLYRPGSSLRKQMYWRLRHPESVLRLPGFCDHIAVLIAGRYPVS